jgi:hypothetical protein
MRTYKFPVKVYVRSSETGGYQSYKFTSKKFSSSKFFTSRSSFVEAGPAKKKEVNTLEGLAHQKLFRKGEKDGAEDQM